MDDILAAMAKEWSGPLWDEAVDSCRVRLLELSEQRPSPGLIERQGVTEDAIKYGQALLKAAADQLLKLKRAAP